MLLTTMEAAGEEQDLSTGRRSRRRPLPTGGGDLVTDHRRFLSMLPPVSLLRARLASMLARAWIRVYQPAREKGALGKHPNRSLLMGLADGCFKLLMDQQRFFFASQRLARGLTGNQIGLSRLLPAAPGTFYPFVRP